MALRAADDDAEGESLVQWDPPGMYVVLCVLRFTAGINRLTASVVFAHVFFLLLAVTSGGVVLALSSFAFRLKRAGPILAADRNFRMCHFPY